MCVCCVSFVLCCWLSVVDHVTISLLVYGSPWSVVCMFVKVCCVFFVVGCVLHVVVYVLNMSLFGRQLYFGGCFVYSVLFVSHALIVV